MSMISLTVPQFFTVVLLFCLSLILMVVIPVKLAAKFERMRRARVRITCRICGFRFKRREKEAYCPHCKSRNR